MNASKSITATFSPITTNLVFVTSKPSPANRGSAAAYDADCNAAATSGGFNNLAGDAFVAWTSDAATTALDRIGPTARGWIRLDGTPFGDTLASIFAGVVFNPIDIDERGAVVQNNGVVWTGMNGDGTVDLAHTCNNWTSASLFVQGLAGSAYGGPRVFTEANHTKSCDATTPIYCFMKTKTTPVLAQSNAGKRIFLSNALWAPSGGAGAADAICEADKPAGTGPVKALLATSSFNPGTLLASAQTYVRPDGTVVGTGAQIKNSFQTVPMPSGIWQTGDGTYPIADGLAWTGGQSVGSSSPGTGWNCTNWTLSTGSGAAGAFGYTIQQPVTWWWNGGTTACSGANARLYCVEL
jgi:hypothetical protein